MTASPPPPPNKNPERFPLDWPAWAGRLLAWSAKLLRVRIFDFPDPEASGAVIFAHWHGDDLAMLPHFGHLHPRILVSQSRDGAILSRAVSVMGFPTSRGSSSRGGAAGLLALKQSLLAGQSVVLAADGPRGPRCVAKPGPVYLAAKTGRPLLPCGAAVSFCHTFRSWNRTRFPLPGARLVIAFGPLTYLPPEAAKWPAHVQSRYLTILISDAARKAELELADWGNVQGKLWKKKG